MDLSRLSTATKVITGAAILLLILMFFNWQQVCYASICGGVSGWHGFVGVVLGLLVIALIAWEVVKILGVELPTLPVPAATIELAVTGGVVVFVILKFLTANEARRWWVQILGLLLAAAIAWGGWQRMSGADDAPVAAATPAAAPPAAPSYTPPAPAEPVAPPAPSEPVAADEPEETPPPAGGTTY
jgi:hypothetical protein